MNLFPFSQTWGEINYYAFGICSVKFYNELFGYLQENFNKEQLDKLLADGTPDSQLRKKRGRLATENTFDDYLKEAGLEKNIKYIRRQNDGEICDQLKTLPMFIRNIIHHPENTYNEYSNEQLKNSTEMMIKLIQKNI